MRLKERKLLQKKCNQLKKGRQPFYSRVRRTNSTLKALKEKFESQIITVQATDSPNQIIENIIHAMEQGSANN